MDQPKLEPGIELQLAHKPRIVRLPLAVWPLQLNLHEFSQ